MLKRLNRSKKKSYILRILKWSIKSLIILTLFIFVVVGGIILELILNFLRVNFLIIKSLFTTQTGRTLLVGAIVLGLLATPFYFIARWQETKIQASEYKQELREQIRENKELIRENEQLKLKAKVAESKSSSPKLTEEGFDTVVDLVFPKQAGERYKQIVTECENSSRDPKRVNVNKDGSIDLGVSQINDRWHAGRVKQIFNEDFFSAMSDSVKNIVYAAFIYKSQGNFSAWVCSRLLVQRGVLLVE